MEQDFKERIAEIMEEDFLYFDEFIVWKMLGEKITNLTLEFRKKAWHIFWNRIGKCPLASLPTMKRWFGIGGTAIPSRIKIYEICFALEADREELSDYLVQGLAEPDVQWNDYHEIIFLYGLEHNYSFERCECLIKKFEQKLDQEMLVEQTTHTKQLEEGYAQNHDMEEDEFFLWLVENARYFKGYSKTSLNYFQAYKEEVCSYVKKDALKRLHILLEETDYYEWLAGRKVRIGEEKRQIAYFLKRNKRRSKDRISDSLAEDIRELSQVAFNLKDTNAMLLSEIWFVNGRGQEAQNCLYNVNAKHLSDILGIAKQKEMAIWIAGLKAKLEEFPLEKTCPKQVVQSLRERDLYSPAVVTVADTLAHLDKLQKDAKRRQLLVQRGDLLPMVLYVAQQRYLEQLHPEESYDYRKARKLFIDMANGVLTACQMAELQKEFKLDTVLLACYQKEEMYEYQDVLEILWNIEGKEEEDEQER